MRPACCCQIPLKHARGVRTIPLPCAAPAPICRILTQACFNRIAFYVDQRIIKVPLIADVTVERFTLPELSCAIQNLVAYL